MPLQVFTVMRNKFVIQELEELLKQYFNDEPLAAEDLLIYIARFPKNFNLIDYNHVFKNSLEFEDAQQIAFIKILDALRAKNFHKGDHKGDVRSFISWLKVVARNAIRDHLNYTREAYVGSNWSLLRKISRRRLKDSLLSQGLPSTLIGHYLLIWESFKSVCIPIRITNINSNELARDTYYNDMIAFYNKHKAKLPDREYEVNLDTIEESLLFCAQAIRSYLYPNVTSFSQMKLLNSSQENIDILLSRADESLMKDLILKEEIEAKENQYKKINQVLLTAIDKLNEEDRNLLKLYYGEGFKQSEVAKQLNIQQYTISRKLSKIRKYLLKSLSIWIEEELEFRLESNTLNDISVIVDEWLNSKSTLNI